MESLANKSNTNPEPPEDNPNQLLMSWIRTVRFNESEKTAMNVKLLKHNDYLNARLLIKTNDYRLENDSVTVNVQMTLKGLKELNKFTYNTIKTITESMKAREAIKEVNYPSDP